jgi:integrase
MPRISNVYLSKKTGKFYFVASLGYNEKGKRVQYFKRGFKTQKEAKNAYDEYMNNYSETGIKKNSAMSFGVFYKDYFLNDYKRSVRRSTFDNRKLLMDKQFKRFEKRELKDISPVYLKKWQNDLSRKGFTNGYVRLIFGMLEEVLDLAKKLGLIQKNSARQIGNVKKQKRKVDFWNIEEFKRVIATFDDNQYYDFFSKILIDFLYMTGLRFGEAQALKWQDIDLQSCVVDVNKSMYYKNADEYFIGEPKTNASIRTIAIDHDTTKMLADWKAIQEKNIGKIDFVLSYNGSPINRSTARHIIEHHAEMAGVHRIKVHALRHSHASMLIAMGENALVIRDRLGHSDVKTTLGTYGHLYPNVNREVANRLVGILDDVKFNKNIKKKRFNGNEYIKRSDL